MDALESRLADAQWLGGQQPSAEDCSEWEGLGGSAPNPDTHPNTFAWWALVSRFTDEVRKGWTGAAAAGGKGKGKKEKEQKKKEEPKAAAAAAAAADDDDFDPFAEGGEEDAEAAAAAEAAMKAKADEAKAKKKKAAPIAKSLVLWDVKGWDDTTDLNACAAKILAEISMDGLTWKTEYKLEPVAFGVKKLVVGAVIEDEKVSADAISEAICEFEDFVQSVDIAVFNKL